MKFRKIFPFLIVAVLLLCGAQTVSAQNSGEGPTWNYSWVPDKEVPSAIFWNEAGDVIAYGKGYEFGVPEATVFVYQPPAQFTEQYAILALNEGKIVAHSFLTGKLCLTVPTVETGPVYIVAAKSNGWNLSVQEYYQNLEKDTFATEFEVADCPEQLEELPQLDFSITTITGDQAKGTTVYTSTVSGNFLYLPPSTTAYGLKTSEMVGLMTQTPSATTVVAGTANFISQGNMYTGCVKPGVVKDAQNIVIGQTQSVLSFSQDIAKKISKATTISSVSCVGIPGYEGK